MPYRRHTFEYPIGESALGRLGRKKRRTSVLDVSTRQRVALELEYVVIGADTVRHRKQLSAGVRQGENSDACIGGVRLWQKSSPADAGVAATGVDRQR